MSLLETIKNDSLKARRANDLVAKNLLVTLLSEAEMVGKNDGNRETTDAEVTVVIRKFLKNINETLAFGVVSDHRLLILQTERNLLSAYIPEELSSDELNAAIAEIGGGLTIKDTGRVMGILNTKFPGRVNGRAVSDILKAG
jgi:uncharacterized protein YqeY